MSKTRNYIHIVFGTKYRTKAIARDRKARLYQYITNTIKNKKCEMISINGIDNHIHLLINLHPTIALADMVKAIKQSSSKWISDIHWLPLFEGWASEYYACSVSPSHVESVIEYIKNQEVHHSSKDYTTELTSFVTKMGMTLYEDDLT